MLHWRYQAKLIFLVASRHEIKFNGAKLLKKTDINFVNRNFLTKIYVHSILRDNNFL